MSKLTILAEAQAAVDTAGTLQSFYFSNAAYATDRYDTPSDQPFVAAMSDPGTLGVSVYGDGRTGGFGALELGSLQLVNADGRFDALKNPSFDGRKITLRLFRPNLAYQALPVLMTATVSTAPEVTRKTVTFGLKDRAAIFDLPACVDLYGGTNVLPAGVDGTTTDIAGARKPRAIGVCPNVTPECVNTSKQIFQVHGYGAAAAVAVYVKGLAYTFNGSDYATNALLQAATISAGQYATCVAEGLFRLNDSLAGTITADVIEGGVQATNLLQQSRTFDNAYWAKFGVGSAVTVNSTTAPDGSLTADTFTGGAADSGLSGATPSLAAATTYNHSVWLMCAAGARTINLYAIRNGGTVVASKICAVTTAWQRFDFDFATLTADTYTLQIGGATTIGVGVAIQTWEAQCTLGAGAKANITTVAATVTAWVPARTAARGVELLALAAGLAAGEISTPDLLALDAAQSAPVGLYLTGDTTFRDGISQLAQSVGGYAVFDPSGVLRVGRLTTPAGAPELLLTESQITSLDRVVQKDGDVPIYEARLNHTKNWTVQASDIAGAVSLARQLFLKQEFRTRAATDATTKQQYLLAESASFDTLLWDPYGAAGGVADVEAQRLRDLYKVRRDMYEVVVSLDVLSTMGVIPRLMSLVQVTSSRLGLSAGQLFWLLGFKVELARSRATLTLWG